jgi:hypothetical protein
MDPKRASSGIDVQRPVNGMAYRLAYQLGALNWTDPWTTTRP